MSISTLESFASRQALDDYFAGQDEQARAEQALRDTFLDAARVGNMAAHFPLSRDAGAAFAESLDYADGPSTVEVLSLLCAVAYGDQPQVARARELLNRMAEKWASANVAGVL